MDRTSQKRKIAYLVGIVVLLIPIFILGMPSDGTKTRAGILSNLRSDYELGESDLGKVDPSSAAMNLVLLGMRGVAANVMWQEMDDQKNRKDWANMERTTDAIIRLQPHFISVWRFNGWNLAFNVSAEWDDVPDRFHWVKKGAKFLKRGSAANQKTPDLPWETGRVCGFKIGLADEAAFFRRYFRDADPDPKFKGRPDPEINPDSLDNYLVAKEWYSEANTREEKVRQHVTDKMIFRSYPWRSQLDYAAARQREGRFGETTRLAWEDGFEFWTKKYGAEKYDIPKEFFTKKIWFELGYLSDEEIIQQGCDNDASLLDKCKQWVDSYQKMVNYRYWRVRSLCEREPKMAEARELTHQAMQLFNESKLSVWEDEAGKKQPGVRQLLDKALQLYADIFAMQDEEGHLKYYPLTYSTEDIGESALLSVLLWQDCVELSPKDGVPNAHPLSPFMTTRSEHDLIEAKQLLKRNLSDMSKLQKLDKSNR